MMASDGVSLAEFVNVLEVAREAVAAREAAAMLALHASVLDGQRAFRPAFQTG